MSESKQIHDATTNEIKMVDFTAAEIKQVEKDAKECADRQAKIQADLQDKAIAKAALLDRLGITADEAALLLG
jgi:hypothetical protein